MDKLPGAGDVSGMAGKVGGGLNTGSLGNMAGGIGGKAGDLGNLAGGIGGKAGDLGGLAGKANVGGLVSAGGKYL